MANLAKTTGFPSIRSMMEDFWNTDRFFERPIFNQIAVPPVNIKDTKSNYEIQLAAPGFNKDDFKIAIEDGLITISAENKSEKKEEKDNYTRQEFSFSEFTRVFRLPENIKEEDIAAKYEDGLLTIDLKKAENTTKSTKTVQVN